MYMLQYYIHYKRIYIAQSCIHGCMYMCAGVKHFQSVIVYKTVLTKVRFIIYFRQREIRKEFRQKQREVKRPAVRS